ncbi:MAG: ArsR family transcriptional regulator [Syntrophobacter sp.]
MMAASEERKTGVVKNIVQEQPPRDQITLPKVLHALSDPVRLEIVLKLADLGEIACGCFGLAMPKSSLSHHFKVLRESGVVATRREGKEWVNTLRREDLETRFPGVLDSVISAALSAREVERAGC